MSNKISIIKKLAVGGTAFVALSFLVSNTIDKVNEKRNNIIDNIPCDYDNPRVGQRPYPRQLPGHKKNFYETYIKRPQDFSCALFASSILAPVMAITAMAVKLKLGSPVIFSQMRPGKDGRIFNIYKFRTMTDEVDSDGKLLPDEDRITPFGKWLRSTSLDELPELFNILKGDMAIIGPRPLLLHYLPLYDDDQSRRHEVRPGLSGIAQVHGRNLLPWTDRFKADVEYVDNISFCLDWTLIIKTISRVLSREGISSNSSVTMTEFQGD